MSKRMDPNTNNARLKSSPPRREAYIDSLYEIWIVGKTSMVQNITTLYNDNTFMRLYVHLVLTLPTRVLLQYNKILKHVRERYELLCRQLRPVGLS